MSAKRNGAGLSTHYFSSDYRAIVVGTDQKVHGHLGTSIVEVSEAKRRQVTVRRLAEEIGWCDNGSQIMDTEWKDNSSLTPLTVLSPIFTTLHTRSSSCSDPNVLISILCCFKVGKARDFCKWLVT